MASGVQVPVELQEVAGQAGHCAATLQDGGVRERMLLARAQRLPIIRGAEDQCGVLDQKGGAQQRKGPGDVEEAGSAGVEGSCSVGVQAEEGRV